MWGIKEHLVVLNVNSVNYANKHSAIHINVFIYAFYIKNCKLGNHWDAICNNHLSFIQIFEVFFNSKHGSVPEYR